MSVNLKYSKSVIKDYKKLSDGRKEYIKKSVVRRQEVIKAQYVEKLKSAE